MALQWHLYALEIHSAKMTALPPGRQPTRRDYTQRSTLLNMKYNASIHKAAPRNSLIAVELLAVSHTDELER